MLYFTTWICPLEAGERILFIKKDSHDEIRFYTRLIGNIREKNLCLITNQAGSGKYLFIPSEKKFPSYFHELLNTGGIALFKILSPEHGLSSQSESTGLGTDMMLTGNIPVIPAYHKTWQELQVLFAGCETILFDLPDAGIRSYTYRTIMTRTIEAISSMKQKPVMYLVDQPNPASLFGPLPPMVNEAFFSYLGEEAIPFFPKYTYAELARYFISKRKLDLDIRYIAMPHYRPGVDAASRSMSPPSPSLPHGRALQCYWIGIFFEGTALDYGKYTKDPFCLIGHPGISYKSDPPKIPGIVFKKYVYKPFAGPYQGVLMRGYEMEIRDISKVQPARAAYTILQYFYRNYPGIKLFTQGNPHYHIDRILGGNSFRIAIEKGIRYEKWASEEGAPLDRFVHEMERFRMY